MEEQTVKIKHKSIKKNFYYNLIFKLVSLLSPILITPYISRVLAADGVGRMSFITSVVSYFVIAANIGIETYGQIVISAHREDKIYLKKFLYDISIMRLILTSVCLLIYYFAFIGPFFNSSSNALYAIYAITLIATAIDFSWFFQGVEDFGILALSGTMAKIGYFVCIFVFVKEKSDLNIAALITVVSNALPFVVSIPFLRKYIKCPDKIKINPFTHFKACMVYFVPTIAVSIYTLLDKTMIGLITNSDFENGYYERAEAIVKMPTTILVSLNIIMRSRISYEYAQGNIDTIRGLITKSMNFMCALCFAMMLGIIVVAPKFIPIYLGEGYDKCVILMRILSPLIPIIGLSNIIGTHYYTPFGLQHKSNVFLIIGAVVNIVLNSFLIFLFQSIGAAIASVSAELIITILYFIFAKEYFNIKDFLKIAWKYILSALVMFGVVFVLDMYFDATLLSLIIEVLIGVGAYCLMLLILRTEFVYDFIRHTFNKMKTTLGRFRSK